MTDPTAGQRLLLWLLPHKQPSDSHDGLDTEKFRLCNTTIILRHDPSDGDGEFVDLISISTAQQGRGDGTQALRLICGMANLYGVKLTVYARAMDDRPASTNRVVEWYRRHGFKAEGCWKPYDAEPTEEDMDHHGADMWREPDASANPPASVAVTV